MFTLPCVTEGCTDPAMEATDQCSACYDSSGYSRGWSRSKDIAWLAYKSCSEVQSIPIPDPN